MWNFKEKSFVCHQYFYNLRPGMKVVADSTSFVLATHLFSMANKPRVVKDYEKLEEDIQEQIKLMYPYGFAKHLIQYKNAEGKFVSALPFETDDRYYLVRMTLIEARQIIEDDEDYDESGELKESVKEEYEEKYGDMDYLTITEGEGASADEEE